MKGKVHKCHPVEIICIHFSRLQADVVKTYVVIEFFVRVKVVKTKVVINPCCQEFLLSENKLSEPMLSELKLSEPMLSNLCCQSQCCQK